jgi:hypothetical protein
MKTFIRKILREQSELPLDSKFQKWFNGSKITTESGTPMICYHGTNDPNIKVFDLSKIGAHSGNYGHYGYGFYFSEDKGEAMTYGNVVYECFIRIINPFIGSKEQIIELKNAGVSGIDDLEILSIDFQSFKNSLRVIPILYSFVEAFQKEGMEAAWDMYHQSQHDNLADKVQMVSDILEFTTFNKNVDGVPQYILDNIEALGISPKLNKGLSYDHPLHFITDLGSRSKEITEVIKKLGYDGVHYGSEIVPFYPNQIKSIHNDGTWNLHDNNIYS